MKWNNRIIGILCCMCFVGITHAQPVLLTRQQYREKVQNYSFQLQQSYLDTDAMRAAKSIAKKGRLPRIDINADGTINLRDLNSWGGSYPTYRTYTYGAVATAVQPIYAGGSLNARQKIAEYDEMLSRLTGELTLDQINYQADAVYWNVSFARSILSASEEYLRIIEHQYEITNDRFVDGMISRTDLLMLATRKQEAQLQFVKSRQNYTLALQQLNILCGNEPNENMDSVSYVGVACDAIEILPLEDVLARRSEYESARIGVERMRSVAKSTLSVYNPQFNAFVNAGWVTANPNMGAKLSLSSLFGLTLSVPVYRWGERKQTRIQQDAYIAVQKLQENIVVDQIKLELAAALTKLSETAEQVNAAEQTMKLAEENLDLVTFSYNEGKSSMVDVLTAQVSWTQAKSNLMNAYLSNKMAVSEYRKVISE